MKIFLRLTSLGALQNIIIKFVFSTCLFIKKGKDIKIKKNFYVFSNKANFSKKIRDNMKIILKKWYLNKTYYYLGSKNIYIVIRIGTKR